MTAMQTTPATQYPELETLSYFLPWSIGDNSERASRAWMDMHVCDSGEFTPAPLKHSIHDGYPQPYHLHLSEDGCARINLSRMRYEGDLGVLVELKLAGVPGDELIRVNDALARIFDTDYERMRSSAWLLGLSISVGIENLDIRRTAVRYVRHSRPVYARRRTLDWGKEAVGYSFGSVHPMYRSMVMRGNQLSQEAVKKLIASGARLGIDAPSCSRITRISPKNGGMPGARIDVSVRSAVPLFALSELENLLEYFSFVDLDRPGRPMRREAVRLLRDNRTRLDPTMALHECATERAYIDSLDAFCRRQSMQFWDPAQVWRQALGLIPRTGLFTNATFDPNAPRRSIAGQPECNL